MDAFHSQLGCIRGEGVVRCNHAKRKEQHKVNYNLLNQEIERSGKKLKALARDLDLSYSGLRRKLDGIYEFNRTEIETLCRVLNLNTPEDRDKVFFNEESSDNK